MEKDLLIWLQGWYESQWKSGRDQSYGMSIYTLTNPGWSVKIDLDETGLEKKSFEKVEIYNDEDGDDHDWYICWVRKGKDGNLFEGVGSPQHLETILRIFKDWVSSIE